MQKVFSSLALRFAGVFIFLLTANLTAAAQQTVRGKITDAASKSPVAGATVVVVGSSPLNGTTTDADGNFRLTQVPVGRIALKITYLGYEDIFAKDIVVNAGKEVILDFPMAESIKSLDEVTVSYKRTDDNRVTNNEMTTVSSRPFTPAETLKYAGSLGDPSRMAANFAGVSGANDARNDIIVRGNSPASLLWRLDGVNIPNPNHFSSLGTSGGPVSMLNTNLLAKSDFMTGAFPAEYANALGSVFDLRLRKGNDEKHEFLTQVGFNGVEIGAEGPLNKKSKASYLLNYRYSLFGLMSNLGFEIAGTPYYQDFTFKTDAPVGKKGNLSFWTIGGKSNITFLGKDVDTEKGDAYGEENTNTRVNFTTGVAALSYEHRFSANTYGKITFSGSRTTQSFRGDTVLYRPESKEILQEIPQAEANFTNEKLSLNASINHKINAKNKVSGGIIVDLNRFELLNQNLYPRQVYQRNNTGETMLSQGYVQWKHRFSQNLTLNAGLTAMHYELSNKTAVEPRLGLSYALNSRSSFNVAYGLHSNLQPILLSFYQTQNRDGSYALTNKNLGFTRSHHLVLGYEQNLGENLRLKVETYYQSLFNVPVEQKASYYSGLTEGVDFTPIDRGNLVNEGSGRNYGVEMTLEKYFSNNYFFLITASLFESKYKGSDGVERNSPFNGKYVLNVLAGKDFVLGRRKNVLSLSWKLSSAGGRFVRPIDLVASAAARSAVFDDSRAFMEQQSGYFRTDLKIGYKLNRRKLTHEIAIDLQNFTNSQNVFQQAYNPRTNRVGTAYQQGFLPIPFYRLTF
ncbi:MAG: TonB-dependent receptor [Cytophagia bacterium]|nr:MAG: TonB-dependent receptor [Runella sp.]TAG18354.1 MAG: TonB-dependent receptor [Cytophagales bacterium]TAG37839.1 MAG: TonB-dependent receptor [Cytophagia bacterium]TAG79096.1 MAG: TonB-dependent receptor [Cytophagales bacterium]